MNGTVLNNNTHFTEVVEEQMTIVASVFLVFTLIGLVGNLIVFWHLSFKIRTNKYTIYILNLSLADAILEIIALVALMININSYNGSNPDFYGKIPLTIFLNISYYAMIYSGMYLLTAISVERCASATFPIWNTVRRPRNLSVYMCCLAWALGILQSLLDNFVCGPEAPLVRTMRCTAIGVMDFVLAVGICLPLMIISSIILLIKIKKTFRQRYPPKLYIIIIVSAIVFTLSVLPLNTIRLVSFCRLIPKLLPVNTVTPIEFWMIVNSGINPYIYFLVGGKWSWRTCLSIKDTLHRAFTMDIDD